MNRGRENLLTSDLKTIKLYDADAYRTTFEACVLEAQWDKDGFLRLVLDQTLFFPEEGGQECDEGVLSASDGRVFSVTDVQIRDGVITHVLLPVSAGCESGSEEDCCFADPGTPEAEPDTPEGRCLFSCYEKEQKEAGETETSKPRHMTLPFCPGDRIRGEIDWEKRFDQMQQHTGEHIFSGLAHSTFGCDNVGFHLSRNSVTMDYNKALSLDQVRQLEEAANRAIRQNHPVLASYPDEETLAEMDFRSKEGISDPVRIVEIDGVDTCACCAPHVRSTLEVGLLKVVSAMRYKGGMRLVILCGGRAFSDYRIRQERMEALSHLLSAPQDGLEEAVLRVLDEKDRFREQLFRCQEALFDLEISRIPAGKKHAVLISGESDEIAARRAVNRMTALLSGFAGVFLGNDQGGYRFYVGSQTEDCRRAAARLREQFGAKGGGSTKMIQGFVKAGEQEIREYFDALP